MNDNKKIVFNTVILYGKLVITTIVGLLSSRYILLSLGSSDFGLYSVVGGIVTFLNVIGVTMVSTSYRFLGVGYGKGDFNRLSQIYSSLSLIHVVIALFLIVLGEIIGIFYINNYLVVPEDKLVDARFVFHISLITAAASVINVPAQGLTIAKEKFLFTSSVEIIVAIIKIFLVISMMSYGGNKLRMFAIIMLALQIITTFSYQLYCRVNDRNVVKYRRNTNIQDYKDIASFTGWSFLGATAYIGNSQGAAVIINSFFGTILNAAYGIASQVNGYANTFIKSITQAIVPQIMKNFGSGNQDRSVKLVYIGCRMSSLALLLLLVPLLSFTREILVLWLKEPPEYAIEFVFFLLLSSFVSVLGAGFDSCIQSTGKIRNNEIAYSTILIVQLPIMYIAYKFGASPFFNSILLCVATLLQKGYQIRLLCRIVSFRIVDYLKEVIKPVFITTLLTLVPVLIIKHIVSLTGFWLIAFILIYELWIVIAIFILGLNSYERNLLISFINKKIKSL